MSSVGSADSIIFQTPLISEASLKVFGENIIMAKKSHNQSGLSLLEIVVTLGIFSMAIVGVSTFITQSYKANLLANEQAEAIENARTGTDIMVKEIREASPAENGAYPIEVANDQNLIFYSDIDSDELIEKVRYYLDGTNLIKAVTDPSGFPPEYINPAQETIISRYVQNGTEPLFYYYNADYPIDTVNNPLITPAAVNNIRLVRTYLKINVDISRAPDNFILISNSQIRNLKDNL